MAKSILAAAGLCFTLASAWAENAKPAASGAEDRSLEEGYEETAEEMRLKGRELGAQGPVARVISWNIQTFGRVKEKRAQAYADILGHMFSDTRSAAVLAIQEIAHEEGARRFEGLLPGGSERWNLAFRDTADSQDNGFYTRKGVEVLCDRRLFPGAGKGLHPPRVAHMRVGDMDFTIVTLHLAYAQGDPEASRTELRAILDWLKEYLARPGADPDVILAGDFNLPNREGKEQSVRGGESSWRPIEDLFEEYPLFSAKGRDGKPALSATRLVALVDEPTSRRQGEPANNYDHFILTGDLYDEEYVPGSAGPMPAGYLETVEEDKGVRVSDHLPISAAFRTSGKGKDGRPIAPDSKACPL